MNDAEVEPQISSKSPGFYRRIVDPQIKTLIRTCFLG
jgi:hypothetical protein